MAQVTGKKVATTPMPTPTSTSGAIIDSFNTQDDKTVNAPSIHIVEDAITTINDNLANLIIVEAVTLATNASFPARTQKRWQIPTKTGYTGYVLQPYCTGSYSDVYAVIGGYTQYGAQGVSITNIEPNTTYTWSVYASVLYVKNL